MGRLSDILRNGAGDAIASAWDATAAAAERSPLPAGNYACRIVSGELFNATSGTPGYKLAFRVLDGEHAGRQLWLDLWLTPAALPLTKRDLSKIGVASLEQLERPIPPGIRARVAVSLRTSDDGTRFNRVKSFDVVGIDPPERDPFAPADPNPDSEPTGDLPPGATSFP